MTIGKAAFLQVTNASIKENWGSFKKSLLEHDATDEQIEAMKAAYYSGAAVAILNFRRMLKIKAKSEAKKVWNEMYDDVDEHMVAMMSVAPNDAMRH